MAETTAVADAPHGSLLHKIADKLVEAARASAGAYTRAMAEIWPDTGAMVRHEPGLPHDGMVTRDQLVAGHKMQDEMMSKALKNYRFDKVSAKVVGDDAIHMEYTQAGTLPDGAELAARIGVRLTLDGGLVRESVLEIDFAELAPMWEILGMSAPEGH